ncbi:MAG: ATP-binding cassette domain-containing protein [Tannerellaceae bacterium]|jgi:ATPase subunit of ABC transporter with duplicated ATPase domains|nr:ATP-binding cassette domain-containing protein [Tannerellaceae bacterium]
MSITLHGVYYAHPDKETLFRNISFTVNKGQKVALIGNNGSGKSTLLRIIAGDIAPSAGEVACPSTPYYMPQHFGQYNRLTIAQALRIERKVAALQAILQGEASAVNFALLDEDWTIEERSRAALDAWGLGHLSLHQPMETLSGGEKTKVFLAGIQIHTPSVILMDEPTNHLDIGGREKLYAFIHSSRDTLLVVTHDMTLLHQMPFIYELSRSEITAYGGDYAFYKEQKALQVNALQASLDEKEKALRKVRKTAREAIERKQREGIRGEKRNEKRGIPRIVMHQLKSDAENSASKLQKAHDGKIDTLKEDIKQIQSALPDSRLMKLNLHTPPLHKGKVLVTAKEIDFRYGEEKLWTNPLSFQIRSGDRLSVKGKNGSGKTTLLRIITGGLEPQTGEITRSAFRYIHIDQEYSIIQNRLTLIEQLEQFNTSRLQDHELKTLLNRFLFPYTVWDKSCANLSGGEKMRLLLCCLLVGDHAPEMLLLDEPSNNLDIQSAEILTSVVKAYEGTVVAVSHDLRFLQEVGVRSVIEL